MSDLITTIVPSGFIASSINNDNNVVSNVISLGITPANIGLGNVDNTSDANKPVSIAQQTALNLKANIAGATFTGAISATNLSGTNTGDQDLSGLVPKTTTVNGKALNTNITLSKGDVGLSAVDNTSDADKPLSNAAVTAIGLKANIANPTFTGIPNAPTAPVDTSTTQIATTAFAKKEADDAQAAAVQRSNHTGTQNVSTITGLGTLATQSGTFSGISSGTNTGDQTISLTGDVSGSGTGSFVTTLKNVGTAGTYNNSATSVQPFTTDAAGRISSTGTAITITPSWSNITNTPSTITGYGITDAVKTNSNQNISGVKTFLSAPTISGNQVATVVDPVRTTLTGNGSLSAFAINGAGSLSNPSALIVAIDGALQEPTVDYGVSGGVITFTSPLANGAKAVVISPTNTLQVSEMIPADGSVSSTKLANDIEVAGQLTVVGQPALSALGDNHAMTRRLSDSHATFLKTIWQEVPVTISRNDASNGGSVGVINGSQSTLTISAGSSLNGAAAANHLGTCLNTFNTSNQGLLWNRPFTIMHSMAKITANAANNAWLRIGSSSAYRVFPTPLLPNYVSAGWVITNSTTSNLTFKAYSYSSGILTFGEEIVTTTIYISAPITFITTSDGSVLRVFVVDRQGNKTLESIVNVPVETNGFAPIADILIINDGTALPADRVIQLNGSVKYAPIETIF